MTGEKLLAQVLDFEAENSRPGQPIVFYASAFPLPVFFWKSNGSPTRLFRAGVLCFSGRLVPLTVTYPRQVSCGRHWLNLLPCVLKGSPMRHHDHWRMGPPIFDESQRVMARRRLCLTKSPHLVFDRIMHSVTNTPYHVCYLQLLFCIILLTNKLFSLDSYFCHFHRLCGTLCNQLFMCKDPSIGGTCIYKALIRYISLP